MSNDPRSYWSAPPAWFEGGHRPGLHTGDLAAGASAFAEAASTVASVKASVDAIAASFGKWQGAAHDQCLQSLRQMSRYLQGLSEVWQDAGHAIGDLGSKLSAAGGEWDSGEAVYAPYKSSFEHPPSAGFQGTFYVLRDSGEVDAVACQPWLSTPEYAATHPWHPTVSTALAAPGGKRDFQSSQVDAARAMTQAQDVFEGLSFAVSGAYGPPSAGVTVPGNIDQSFTGINNFNPGAQLPVSANGASDWGGSWQTTVVVEKGDNLWTISKALYGDGADYTKLYAANKGVIGGNPNLIQPGEALVIGMVPAAAAGGLAIDRSSLPPGVTEADVNAIAPPPPAPKPSTPSTTTTTESAPAAPSALNSAVNKIAANPSIAQSELSPDEYAAVKAAVLGNSALVPYSTTVHREVWNWAMTHGIIDGPPFPLAPAPGPSALQFPNLSLNPNLSQLGNPPSGK